MVGVPLNAWLCARPPREPYLADFSTTVFRSSPAIIR